MLVQKINSTYSEQLWENNAAAWQHLIRIFYPVLCRVAKKILKDDAAAEDVTTEVFLNVWQKKIEFEDLLQVKKYLYTSIRNGCLNVLRSKQREEARHETFANTYLQNDASLDKEIIYSEVLAEIRKEIDRFSPRMRHIFIMAYLEQKTNEEIAGKLNLSNQTVRNQKASALALLRNRVKPKFGLHMISMGLIP